MYLLDTNVVSELVRPRPEPTVVAWVDAHGGDCGLSTIALFELRLGVAQLPDGRRRACNVPVEVILGEAEALAS